MKARVCLVALGLLVSACSTREERPASATPKLLLLPSAVPSRSPTERPATPIIIATDTPVPTPVTYVVQEGDTLVGVAVKFGVSVEALQAANNNVQPQFLSIGAVLTIPSPEGGPVAEPTGAPTPAPIDFGPVACYRTITDTVYCFVEARNSGDGPLGNVSAQIILAGADGLPLASAIGYSPLDVIPPGKAAPLAVSFPAAPAGVAATAARVRSAQPSSDASILLLEIPAHTGQASGAAWTVAGQVRNPADTPAASAWLTLTLYDSAGLILGYRKVALVGGLAAGEAREFSLSATSLGGPVDHYGLAAEGQP